MKTPIASVPAVLKPFLLSLPLEGTFSKSVLEIGKKTTIPYILIYSTSTQRALSKRTENKPPY
jgi:hypothetical protein